MVQETEKIEAYRKSAIIVAVVVALFTSFMIIRPFMVAILSAAALAYIFYPLDLRLAQRLPRHLPVKKIASLITCLLIVLSVLLPTLLLTVFLTFEVRSGYLFLQQNVLHNGMAFRELPFIPQELRPLIPTLKETAIDLLGGLFQVLQEILKRIPNLILTIFITVFSTYYFLLHGKDLYRFFSEIFPLPEKRYQQILSRFDGLTRGMIMGQIVVGFIQGLLAWGGFLLLGVPNPLLWAFMTALISIVPLLGAVLVWFPVALYLFAVGSLTGNYWPGLALLFYGTFVISLVDNFLKPKIVGDQANIHPLIILFGIFGGIQLFGLPGILIGPLVLTIFDLVIEIYKETL